MSVNESVWLADSAVVRSTSYEGSAKIYGFANVTRSVLGHNTTIGESAVITNCITEGFNSLNRRNFLLRSKIGRFTYTGINTLIRQSSVGRFCSLSWNVSVGGGNHPMANVTTYTKERFLTLAGEGGSDRGLSATRERLDALKGCWLGNDVWIGMNVNIVDGVTIGNGSVIGAGAVVTKDVEPYSIVAGVPAKVIRKRFDDDTLEKLQEIQWWNWPVDIIREHLDLIYSTKVDSAVLEKLQEIGKSLAS